MLKKIMNLKTLYLIIVLLFAFPSLYHIINSGFLLKSSEYFTVLINGFGGNYAQIINMSIYAGFFIAMFVIYSFFLKNRNKIFKTNKELLIFILIVSILFGMILPITSSDVFSYAKTGEIQSTYGANPYYDKISDIKSEYDTQNNEILNSINMWEEQLVIYGPLWSLICWIIAFFSFSKISIILILFKLLAIIVHCINAVLVFKISKKKFWVIFYGLNPYVLFETISNVHNDIYLIFFTLLALYFFINKKNLTFCLLFLACATCIKYITVLLVPLLLIYYYRNETLGKRVLKCIKSGLLFSLFVTGIYLIYLRSFDMIFYVLIQQGKYRESISMALYIIFYKLNKLEYSVYFIKSISVICAMLYVFLVWRLLLKKDITFKEIMNSYNMILLVFILVFISNLCVWYFVWLFATVIWQKSTNIKIVMYLPLIYEICVSYYFFLGGEYVIKSYWYALINIVLVLLIISKDNKKILRICE